MKNQPPLDGISLVTLIESKMKTRSKPMGFWDHPTKGISTPSQKWMTELLEVQKAGGESSETFRLRLDAGEITEQYPLDSFPGHAAWLDWPWKLHRIHSKKAEVKFELYNLAEDPDEQNDLIAQNTDRANSMKSQLQAWLTSIVHSLNGRDYR
jgi:hypothetical protein